MSSASFGKALEQNRRMLTKSASDFQYVVKAEISLTAFNAANVRRVQASLRGKLLLRPSFRKSKLSNLFPKSNLIRR